MATRHDFDGLFKDMLRQDQLLAVDRVSAGHRPVEFVNVEIQTVQQARVDLAMLLSDGSILSIEFQSTNDHEMVERMAIYHVQLGRRYGQPVRNVLFYVGPDPLTMKPSLDTPQLRFKFDIIDARSFRVDELLATGRPADAVMAILAKDGESRLRDIMQALRRLPDQQMRRAVAQASVVCHLRDISSKVKEEISKTMPVIMDIEENVILRDILEEGIARGLERGKAEGKAEGKVEAARQLLHVVLEKRFGPVPAWVSARIAQAGVDEIQRLMIKTVTAHTLEAVFRGKRR